MIKPNQLLEKTKQILENEGGVKELDLDDEIILSEFILPGLKNSKEVLSSIYSFKSRNRVGLLGKIKTFLQNKIIFTVINVMEKQSMKQQKFNELTYKGIEILINENKKLNQEIDKLKVK